MTRADPLSCTLPLFLAVALLSWMSMAAAEDLRVRKPVATIGGGTGALSMEDANRLWTSLGPDLVLLNVTDPSDISIESRLRLGESLSKTIKNRNVLYAAGRDRKFWVIDIEDPLNPKVMKQLLFEREATKFGFVGDRTMFLDGTKVKVYDFSNPREPSHLQDFELGYWSMLIHTEAALGFTGSHRDGIRVYDQSDPSAPREVGKYPLDKNPTGFVMNGSIAFIGESQMGIHAVDFSNPAEPKKIGYVENQGVSAPLYLAENYLFQPGVRPDLTVYDVSDATNLVKIAEIDSSGGAEEVLYANGKLFLPSEGLKVYDFSQPKEPRLIGKFSNAHLPRHVHYRSGVAYVGGNSAELAVVDCADPSDPRLEGFVQLKGLPKCIAGKGNHLYISSAESGMEVFELSDPFQPQLVYHDGSFRKVQKLEFRDEIGVALELNGAVLILDISEPSHPKKVGVYYQGGGTPQDAEWVNGLMMLAAGSGGAQFVDLTYPFSPFFKSLIGLERGVSHVGLVGSTAILTEQQISAKWFDVSDPLNAVEMGTFEETPAGVVTWGDRAFFTGYQGGVEYDFSDPKKPLKMGTFQNGLGMSAVVFDDLLFDPGLWAGLRIFDLAGD